MRCRAPRHPAGNIANYRALTPTLGNMIGICPDCSAVMYRTVNVARLEGVRGSLEIA